MRRTDERTAADKRRTKARNKAGYTANTSRGRVGRGGNVCFHTFQLDHHGPTDGRTNGQTDKASYRVACPQLKKEEVNLLKATMEVGVMTLP